MRRRRVAALGVAALWLASAARQAAAAPPAAGDVHLIAALEKARAAVVLVRGTDGVCGPMFPVYPHDLTTAGNTTLANLVDGNVGESGTMALGFTNALYVGP